MIFFHSAIPIQTALLMYNLLIASLSRRKTWPLYSRNCSAETGWRLGHVSRDWPPFGVDPGMIFTSFLRKRQQEARLEDKLWFIQQCQPRPISLILLLNCCGAYFVLYDMISFRNDWKAKEDEYILYSYFTFILQWPWSFTFRHLCFSLFICGFNKAYIYI